MEVSSKTGYRCQQAFPACCAADPYAGSDSGVLVKVRDTTILRTLDEQSPIRRVRRRAFGSQTHKLITRDGHIWCAKAPVCISLQSSEMLDTSQFGSLSFSGGHTKACALQSRRRITRQIPIHQTEMAAQVLQVDVTHAGARPQQ